MNQAVAKLLLASVTLWVAALMAPNPAVAQAKPGDAASGVTPGANASGPLKFGFADGTVRVSGTGEVKGVVVFTASQLDKAQLDGPLQAVTDVPVQGLEATTVTFDADKAVELSRQTAARSWMVPYSAKGLTTNTQQTRFAQAEIAGGKAGFSYVLTNRTATPVEFGVTIRPQWVVTPRERATAVMLESREQPVSGLRIALSTLAEQSVGTPIEVQALELCPEEKGACAPIGTLPPQTPRTVYLRWKPDYPSPGLYKGSLSLAVDGRGEPKPLTVEIASSNPVLGLVGGVVILIGVVGAWFVNVHGRLLVARLSLLQLATAVRQRLDDMDSVVEHFDALTGGPPMDNLRGWLRGWSKNLEESNLAGLLPFEFAFYKTFDEAPFKAFLGRAESATKVLDVLVREGVEVLEERWTNNPAPAARDAVLAAARRLDVKQVADEAAARLLVNAALNPVALAVAMAGGGHPPPVTARQASERIAARIEFANVSAWLVYLLLVALTGIALLVLRSSSFGTWLDFVYCFFWGFGLPTTLDKLQPLTPSSIASTMSVTLPK